MLPPGVTPEPTAPREESVWAYPRPPRVEPVEAPVRVVFGGVEIARTERARRVLETSHPPVYYLPPPDVRMDLLSPAGPGSHCEWKGRAVYYDLRVGDRVANAAAWAYPDPTPRFESIRDHLAFYAGRVDACFVGDERVRPQPGGFYGGWVTADVKGPFKGAPGTWGW
ncbi:MAG: DUF427 domain-containing protein [Rhodothermales bacterium]|nr:DUF427 domain-containing protein [Rhodothermales bacterium]